MKKIICRTYSIFYADRISNGGRKNPDFQWQQDVMVTGDKWEMHASDTSGGPYILNDTSLYLWAFEGKYN